MIGSGNPRFFGGETDLRGVYVAEGVVGQVTAGTAGHIEVRP